MEIITPIPGSFRDPSGQVYQVDGRILRTVNECFAGDFEFVQATGLLKTLASKGWILPIEVLSSDVLSPIGVKSKYVLETSRLPFVSFPYEWSFSALKEAALLHLQIHLHALEVGVTLSDASAYNIQFQGRQPVFIDHLSFKPYRTGEIWAGHRQFCEQFLNPLLLRAFFGIPHNAWYRGAQEGITAAEIRSLLKWRHFWKRNVLTHVVLQNFFQNTAKPTPKTFQDNESATLLFPLSSFKHLLGKMYMWIDNLQPLKRGKSIWGDYAQNCSYSFSDSKIKKQFILEFAQKVKPKLLWDLGCNTGDYAETAIEGGADYVVGFDFDQGALEASYKKAFERHLPFQALFMDVANPSPNQGWNNQERESLQARATGDALLALALIHHLVIARNIPLHEVVNWLVSLAPQGVIEFVPKQDPMVQELLRLRKDIFPEYTYENFFAFLNEKAIIIKTETKLSSGRVLMWFERK
jgi:ribosomal protein L11 methylase PrmA